MGKIKVPDFSNVKDWEELKRYASIAFQTITDSHNGNIGIDQNLDAQTIGITFTAVNQDTLLQHTLGRIPKGYIPVSTSVGMHIFTGVIAPTASTFYLKSDTIGNAKILLF